MSVAVGSTGQDYNCYMYRHVKLNHKNFLMTYFYSKIFAHIIGDVHQFTQGNVYVLQKVSCQMVKTDLLNGKQV